MHSLPGLGRVFLLEEILHQLGYSSYSTSQDLGGLTLGASFPPPLAFDHRPAALVSWRLGVSSRGAYV